jgi:hypothetical protein
MKKILSLVMVVAMLVAVLALVGCNDTKKPDDTTTSGTTDGTTTSGTTDGTTTSGTTEGTTTSGTTEGTTTSSSESATSETTTLPPVFARFDFGTASKGEDLGMTSHEYLTTQLTYDAEFISVEYTEDTIIVTAVKDHPEITFDNSEEGKGKEVMNGYTVTSYALCYEDLAYLDYDFLDELTKEKNFMRVRIKNQTTNNIMAFRWHKAGQEYATTLLASCMYLQGGAPDVDDYKNGESRLTCEASDKFQSFDYDINFVAALGRFGANKTAQSISYAHMAYYVGCGGSTGSNNWNWMGTESIAALEFFVLGAFGGSAASQRYYYTYADTRANIVEGATVEIDYIIFGAKGDLKTFTSYIEDESISVSKSISESESIAAAATATTAAA